MPWFEPFFLVKVAGKMLYLAELPTMACALSECELQIKNPNIWLGFSEFELAFYDFFTW